jgi:hypothetical protein
MMATHWHVAVLASPSCMRGDLDAVIEYCTCPFVRISKYTAGHVRAQKLSFQAPFLRDLFRNLAREVAISNCPSLLISEKKRLVSVKGKYEALWPISARTRQLAWFLP